MGLSKLITLHVYILKAHMSMVVCSRWLDLPEYGFRETAVLAFAGRITPEGRARQSQCHQAQCIQCRCINLRSPSAGT